MYNLPIELKLEILSYYPINSKNIKIYYEFLPKNYVDKLAFKWCIQTCKEIIEMIKRHEYFN